MKRWLAVYSDDNGAQRSAMISVPDERESDFPFGSEEHFVYRLNDYNRGGGLALIEMPDAEFRPVVVDVQEDDEIPMQFIDL